LPVHDQTPAAQWYALWTASHCERLVRDHLAARGFTVFLPEVQVWSRRRGQRRLVPSPMFPGYLFLQHEMTRESYVEVRKARGLVRILGDGWDRLAAVPGDEVETIHRVHTAQVPALPHPFLARGQRVRLTAGPLAGVEGTLVDSDPGTGMLVVSVSLLQRSIAVPIDCTCAVPVQAAPPHPRRKGQPS